MHEEAYGRFLLLSFPLSLYSMRGFLPSSTSYERDQLELNWPEPGVLTEHRRLFQEVADL